MLCYDVVLACFHPSWRLSSAGTGADIGKQRRKSSIASPSTAVDRVHCWHCHHDADCFVRRSSGEYLLAINIPTPYSDRAVANGPVSPAMAGPIIEPVISIF